MSKRALNLVLAGVLVVCAIGAIALKAARATPPVGVTQSLLAGPTVLDEIQVVTQTPEHGVILKTREIGKDHGCSADGGNSSSGVHREAIRQLAAPVPAHHPSGLARPADPPVHRDPHSLVWLQRQ